MTTDKIKIAMTSLKYVKERFAGYDAEKMKGYFDDIEEGLRADTIQPPTAERGEALEAEPPCGAQCPKDEDCGNFNFHGEGCTYNPKLSKAKAWKAINALEQAKFDFKVPMAANRKGAMLLPEHIELIEAALSFAYHHAEDTGEKYAP